MEGMKKFDEDSGSDWDSVSEMDPSPPKKEGHRKTSQRPNIGQPADVPRKLNSMTFVDPAVGKKYGGEKPPFDFKSELNSPRRVTVGNLSKPGKSKKGKVYDPHEGAQKHVSFVEDSSSSKDKPEVNGRISGPDSESDDPLYSTVKRKPHSSNKECFLKGNQEEQEKENLGKAMKKPSKSPHKTLQGHENKGYLDDEESSIGKCAPLDIQEGKKGHSSHGKTMCDSQTVGQLSHKNPLVSVEEKTMESSPKAVISVVEKEVTQPLILTLGKSSMESAGRKPVEAVNRAMAEACTVLTFPLICVSLFLHHFLRFILQGLIRPLIVDSCVLVVEYLLRPLMTSVVKPILISLHGASTSLSDIIVVCVRPITTLLQSFRLVEINYTRKYSIEEI